MGIAVFGSKSGCLVGLVYNDAPSLGYQCFLSCSSYMFHKTSRVASIRFFFWSISPRNALDVQNVHV